MFKKLFLGALITVSLVGQTSALDGKTIGHVISIPIIEGTGIYSSIRLLKVGEANTTAASIANLSLIGINAGLGAYTLFGKPDNFGQWHTIHRITGFVTCAASLWLTVSAGVNQDVRNIDKGISAGYSVLTVVPLILFSF
jgi:hypothetical protein